MITSKIKIPPSQKSKDKIADTIIGLEKVFGVTDFTDDQLSELSKAMWIGWELGIDDVQVVLND